MSLPSWLTVTGPAWGQLHVDTEAVDGATVVRVQVRNVSLTSQSLDRVDLMVSGEPRRVLEHGWQSWSPVRACDVDDVRPERLSAPLQIRQMYTAVPDRAGLEVLADHFLLSDLGVVGFLSAERHLSTVAVVPGGRRATAWFDAVPLAAGEIRELDPLWVRAGSCFESYLDAWGRHSNARPLRNPGVGWCTWYQYFGLETEDDVAAQVKLAADSPLAGMQIDAGYQLGMGDWLVTKPSYPYGTSSLAAGVVDAGLWAGIWLAPFLANPDSRLAAAHPDWLLRDAAGELVVAMEHELLSGVCAALDLSIPAVHDFLADTFATLRAEGFTYFKTDFLYAGALDGVRSRRDHTRAENFRTALAAIRRGIGEDAYWVGCGSPLAGAVGLVDAMRVSADTDPRWPAPEADHGFPEGSPSAENAIKASLLRAPMHGRLFAADPDCMLLRPDALQLRQRHAMAAAIAACSGFLVVSDDLALYGEEQWAQLAELAEVCASRFGVHARLADPLAEELVLTAGDLELVAGWSDLASLQVTVRGEAALPSLGDPGPETQAANRPV